MCANYSICLHPKKFNCVIAVQNQNINVFQKSCKKTFFRSCLFVN